MAGRQDRLRRSLQFRLSFWLSLLILLVALAAGLFSLWSAFGEANDLQDDQLKQVALLINHNQWSASHADNQENIPGIDLDARLVIQWLPIPAGTRRATLSLPGGLPDGMQTVVINHQSWRIYVSRLDHGGRVAVGQLTELRDEIARDSALRTMMPFALLIPLLLLLVGRLIQQMLKPLKNIAQELNGRSDQDLRPMDAGLLPSEVVPFVQAINRLLARVAQSMALQQRFVADAAHELRSPLTALSLQAERLEAADLSAPARERLLTLRHGLRRAQSLLEQLLALARAQQGVRQSACSTSVAQVFRQVLEDLLPLAQAKNLDIGVEGVAEVSVDAASLDLTTLVKNLVENAIRYTPQHGRVDLSIRQAAGVVTLCIEDSGPGIAAELRSRVCDPFFRILGSDENGSGLGLSIVKTICDRLGARLEMADVSQHAQWPGLRVCVHFPRKSKPIVPDAAAVGCLAGPSEQL